MSDFTHTHQIVTREYHSGGQLLDHDLSCVRCGAMNSDLAAYPCPDETQEEAMDELNCKSCGAPIDAEECINGHGLCDVCGTPPEWREYDRDSENLRLLALYNRRRERSRARVAAAFAKLDEIASRFTPTGPSSLDRIVARAQAVAPRVKVDLAEVRLAPVEDVRPTRCTCQDDPHALQVVRATEYNERRALDAPAWELPEFVLDRAADAMERCEATIHFPSLLDETAYTVDPEAVDWTTVTPIIHSHTKIEVAQVVTGNDTAQKMRRDYEDALAAQASRNVLGERWEGEYEAYESTDRFVRELTEKRRSELASLLRHLGQNPADPKIVAWVKLRIASKHGNALRGYCSCLASLRRRLPQHA